MFKQLNFDYHALWRTMQNKLIKRVVLLVIAIFPLLVFAEDDPLAEYQNMIDQAHRAPVKNNTQPFADNSEAALMPAAPAAAPPAAAALSPLTPAAPAAQPTQQSQQPATNNGTNVTNKPSSTYTGPPNIFVTPGGNSTNSQGSSVIHY